MSAQEMSNEKKRAYTHIEFGDKNEKSPEATAKKNRTVDFFFSLIVSQTACNIQLFHLRFLRNKNRMNLIICSHLSSSKNLSN